MKVYEVNGYLSLSDLIKVDKEAATKKYRFEGYLSEEQFRSLKTLQTSNKFTCYKCGTVAYTDTYSTEGGKEICKRCSLKKELENIRVERRYF